MVCAAASLPVVGGAVPATPSEPLRNVSAWLPYWDASALDSFVANQAFYDQLLPFWYEMRSSRSVHHYEGAGDAAVIDAARAAGVPLLPTITNDFDAVRVREMLASDASIDTHVATLTALAAPYAGIDVDYESLRAEDRGRFTRFTERLAASLHARGKLLSMTLHPKTSEPGTWDGPQAQDWAAIGAAADRVRIMAYDLHWATSEAGPVAPAGWVEDVARFAVQRIPAAKVNLGIPLYGYDWVGTAGRGLVWQDADALRRQRGATLERSAEGEPSFRYETAGARHVVWFSDAGSVAPKLRLASELGLSGVTFWRLGGEDPAVWDAVGAWHGAEPEPEPEPVDVTPPGAIGELRAQGAPGRVRLRWASAQDASAVVYRILRSTSASGRFTPIATVRSTRFDDSTMRPGRTSWYAVRPVDAAGNLGPRSRRVAARPAT